VVGLTTPAEEGISLIWIVSIDTTPTGTGDGNIRSYKQIKS
jgi:hypothetical protein